MNQANFTDGILRYIKGIFIGTGFILPGVSGGALAAIFGLYEKMIAFAAHPTHNFKKNIWYFLPVLFGMLTGIVLLSYPLSFCLEHYYTPTMWYFIGCIIGTFPALWNQAGKYGHTGSHLLIMAEALAAAFLFLKFGSRLFNSNLPQTSLTWMMAGALIALGTLIPGLSPSNFLLYIGMYGSMVTAFKTLKIATLFPIAIGGLLCLLLFSKVVDLLFHKAYSVLFHIILGIVIASTLIIIPAETFQFNFTLLLSLISCGIGIMTGLWMSSLESKYKPHA